jgi:hypothetical protein
MGCDGLPCGPLAVFPSYRPVTYKNPETVAVEMTKISYEKSLWFLRYTHVPGMISNCWVLKKPIIWFIYDRV